MTPTPLKLNKGLASETSYLGMYNAAMFSKTDAAQNDFNTSIWTQAKKTNTSNSITSATKAMNAAATVGFVATLGTALVSVINMFKPAKQAGQQGGEQPTAKENTVVSGLKNAAATAEKTHDYAPLQAEVTKAWQNITAKKGELIPATTAETKAQAEVTKAEGTIETTKLDIAKAVENISSAKKGLSDATNDVNRAKDALAAATTPEAKAQAQTALTTAEAAEKAAQVKVDSAEAEKVKLDKQQKEVNEPALAKAKTTYENTKAAKTAIEQQIKNIQTEINSANAVLSKRGKDIQNPDETKVNA